VPQSASPTELGLLKPEPGEIAPAAVADGATVDSAGRRLATGIDGVLLRMLGPLQADHRGSLSK
jgi:hypothetical protein